MINGLDCNYGFHKVGFQSKNGNLYINARYIIHPQIYEPVDFRNSTEGGGTFILCAFNKFCVLLGFLSYGWLPNQVWIFLKSEKSKKRTIIALVFLSHPFSSLLKFQEIYILHSKRNLLLAP